RIGLETSGKQVVYGSLDEILDVVSKVRGTVPVLNFPHIHAREHGSLQTKEEFQDVFDRARKASKLKWFYTHFSGVQHEGGNEKRYTPIKKGDLKFEPLAECVLENDFNITIISSSPLLEHDAMYMKVILERVMLKREAKLQRMMKEAAK
ncbi:MAG: AP endonuclease, partial [Thermoplasmata archaeon]|nr:AP endonuclease [Thermoplasmata archaeon]